MLLAAGCGGLVTGMAVKTPKSCDTSSNICGNMWSDNLIVEVTGKGLCSSVKLNMGDGTFDLVERDVDFDKGPWVIPIRYVAGQWSGPKTIRAEGVTNCSGKATTSHHVFLHQSASVPNRFDSVYSIGFVDPTLQCYAVPSGTGGSMPPLRTNTKVTIKAPNPTGVLRVNFGCLNNGCIHDVDGKPGSSAPAHFPYPGFRAFSLILTVGTQVIQGSTDVTFVTNQPGSLLLCVNDDQTYDNTGGWELEISVDESNAF
jgi:hypothetical protein